MTFIFNTVFLKMHLVLDLSKKMNSKPNNLAKDIHFMKSALLLLSNSQFKVDAVLKTHGLERVPVAKDGNCLFASVSFSLLQLLTTDGCSLELQQHLNCIGITGNRTLPELIKLLRKLAVDEFLSCNSLEYSSFLLSANIYLTKRLQKILSKMDFSIASWEMQLIRHWPMYYVLV